MSSDMGITIVVGFGGGGGGATGAGEEAIGAMCGDLTAKGDFSYVPLVVLSLNF